MIEPIQVFDSQGEDYKRAFQIFLDHTDQKRNAKRFLQQLVDDLPDTLYYIPADEWLAHLERLVSWMSPTGVTVVVIQNRGTACTGLLDHFFGHRFDLEGLATAFRAKHGDRYDISITLDPAHVETSESASAYAVAEFMLNLLPISQPPAKRDVEAYLVTHCTTGDGTYRLSVHQDFLRLLCSHSAHQKNGRNDTHIAPVLPECAHGINHIMTSREVLPPRAQ